MSSAGLDAIATDDHTFAVVAMDQRGTLARMYSAVGRDDVPDEEKVALKRDVLDGLRGVASAFLVDPDYGLPAARSLGAGPRFGTLIAAEPAKRGSHEGEPRVHRDAALSAAWVREQGGNALKFLVQVRADRVAEGHPDLTAEALDVVREVVADCAAEGVPSVIENLIYPLKGAAQLSPEERTAAILGAAEALDDARPSLLKLEYPGSPEACRTLAGMLHVPWAVLSAGVSMTEFSEVLRVSCDEGGASGFIAGRAIWKETVGMDPAARQAFLAGEGSRRLEECRKTIDGRARPWREAVS